MTRDELRAEMTKFFDECLAVFDSKGTDYESNTTDAFSGVIDAADEAGVEPLQVLYLYWHKHYTPWKNTVNGRKLTGVDSLRSRAVDMVNYIGMTQAYMKDQ